MACRVVYPDMAVVIIRCRFLVGCGGVGARAAMTAASRGPGPINPHGADPIPSNVRTDRPRVPLEVPSGPAGHGPTWTAVISRFDS